jgi:hypothetical protein
MALTATKRVKFVAGSKRIHVYNVTFDNSYPTGGESLTAGIIGLNWIEALIPAVNGTEFAVYDYTNKKLKLFTADGTEAGNASDQSAVSVTVFAIGE